MKERTFQMPSSMVFIVERDFMSGDPAESKRFDRLMQHIKEAGFSCFRITSEFRFVQQDMMSRDLFKGIPVFKEKTYAFWMGHVLRQHTYARIYENFLKMFNIELIHPPEMHRSLILFDEERYNALADEDLTAQSVVIQDESQVDEALDFLGGFPVFVKGGIQSLKSEGWESCIFFDREGLDDVVKRLLKNPLHKIISEGYVVFRKYIPLEIHGYSRTRFPMGMEMRYFFWRDTSLARGMYWRDMEDVSLTFLDQQGLVFDHKQEREISELTQRVAREFGGLYTVIDIARDKKGNWKLIEVGDGQVAGLGRVNPTILWSNLNICLVEKNVIQSGRARAKEEAR